MNRKIVSLFISLFYFQAQSQNNWTSKKDKIKIPFELTHNIIIIDVVFNGTNLKMIADTGSSRNMIFSVPENDSLIINKANKIFISGVGLNENIEGFLSQNNSISIKDYIDDKFEVVLINNHEISIVNKLGIPINGIIGSSFFKHFLVEIDYQRKLIILHKNKEAKLAKIKKKYAKSEISITESKPYINLLTKIENKEKKLNLLFDTGLGDGLWLFENDSIQCNSNFFIDFFIISIAL